MVEMLLKHVWRSSLKNNSNGKIVVYRRYRVSREEYYAAIEREL